ncbi:hypothetical protein GCM10027167_39780 [Nocardia heshunensis]
MVTAREREGCCGAWNGAAGIADGFGARGGGAGCGWVFGWVDDYRDYDWAGGWDYCCDCDGGASADWGAGEFEFGCAGCDHFRARCHVWV